MDTYVVKRLEQAKLLTDPFKLKLLERFAGKPVTTKQVADRMGEKAPRLYRHVDALVDAGLLTLVEEKPKRGTIERYYRTVADRFEVDPGLFTSASDEGEDALGMIRSLFRESESDLLRFFDRHRDDELAAEDLPLVVRYAIRGTPAEVAELKGRLESWLEDVKQQSRQREDSDDLVSWSCLLAMCPQQDQK
jgi:DNA-binding transcriptional ArsR family regulator